jgi:hypothetical protein
MANSRMSEPTLKHIQQSNSLNDFLVSQVAGGKG